MARLSGNVDDAIDKEMRHESIDLGLRYPGEFIEFLWGEYKKFKEERETTEKSLKEALMRINGEKVLFPEMKSTIDKIRNMEKVNVEVIADDDDVLNYEITDTNSDTTYWVETTIDFDNPEYCHVLVSYENKNKQINFFTVENYLTRLFEESMFEKILERLHRIHKDWGSYDVEKVENIYPLKLTTMTLYEGPVENQGEAKYSVFISENQEEKVAEVQVEVI